MMRSKRPAGAALAAAALPLLLAAASPGSLPEGWPDDTPCELPRVERETAGWDSCVACHAAGRQLPRYFQMTPGGFGHPVGIHYEDAQRRAPDDYLPREQLPAAVTLPQGQLTCTSCHDPRSALPHRTVLAPERDLCVACHRM